MKSILEYLINKTTKEKGLHPKFTYNTEDYFVCRFKDLNKENCLLDTIFNIDSLRKTDDPEVVYIIISENAHKTFCNFNIESTGKYLYSGVATMSSNPEFSVTLLFHKNVLTEILKELRQDLTWNKNRSIIIRYYDKYKEKEYESKLTAGRIRWNDNIIKELVKK